MDIQDQVFTHTLGKFRVLEVTLMALLLHHPNREGIKKSIRLALERLETRSLFETMSDEERAIALRAHEETFDALFPELPSDLAAAEPHKT